MVDKSKLNITGEPAPDTSTLVGQDALYNRAGTKTSNGVGTSERLIDNDTLVPRTRDQISDSEDSESQRSLSDPSDVFEQIASTSEDENGENVSTPSNGTDFDALISSLNSAIEKGYSTLLGINGENLSIKAVGESIVGILNAYKDAFKRGGLNDTNSWQMSQTVYDTIFSLVNQSMTNNIAMRNWYMQQDYNLPSNQILRLMEAGINPAFYYGCASKSNADAISSQAASSPQPTSLPDPTNISDTKRQMMQGLGVASSAASVVGSLVQGGFGGVTQGIKNLADSTATMGSYELQKNLNPYQMSLLQANAANTWAQKFLADTDAAYKPQVYKAQQYQLIEQGKNYSQSVALMQKDIDAKLQIAKWANEATRYSSDKSFLSTIMSANIGAAASRYAADSSASAMKFSSRLSIVPDILKHVYTHQREEQLYDASSGQKLSLSAEERAKFNLAIAKGDLDFKEGVEFTWNNRKVRGYYFDTDVLDAVRLNNMNNYFNNFIETGHVFGKSAPDMSKMSSDASDYLNMVDYAMPYINKAAAHAITSKMMNYPMKSDKGLLEPVPMFGQWNAKNGNTFQPAKY